MVMTSDAADMLIVALHYAARGLPVFPCQPDKKPLTHHGFKDATTDAEQIKAWWTRWPTAMIGMPTGNVTDLHVVDVDVHQHDGFITLKKLSINIEGLPRVVTPSGGNHFYHRLGGRSVKNTVGRLGPGIDTRASGGYIILPPSRPDPAKPSYAFINDVDLLAAPMIPEELLKLLRDSWKRTPQQELEVECSRVAAAPEGCRNDVLNRAAFRVAKLVGTGGLTEAGVRNALTKAALKSDLGIAEIEHTLESAFEARRRESRSSSRTEGAKRQGRALV